MKLLLTVLVLIVLPTALLSLLAGLSIQSREVLLDQRLEAEAEQTLEQIGAEVLDAIHESQAQIAGLVKETILDANDKRAFDIALATIRNEETVFDAVYLFSDPWGFIYPENAIPESEDFADSYVLLAHELAMRLRPESQSLFFAVGDQIFVFHEVYDGTRLFAGFEILQDRFIMLLERVLDSHSTAHIEYRLLRVSPMQPNVPAIEEQDVAFIDSLDLRNDRFPSYLTFLRDRQRTDVLLSGHLRAPFTHIEIGAIALNASDMYAARALQARLVRWSILLLAIVLLSSAVIVILMARKQAEATRIRSVFIAGLSHDIRTPITAMRALAESLQHGRVSAPERRQQFLDSIVDECDRLQTLIERVLLFFRQEQGGYYQKRPIDLVSLCEHVTQAFCGRHRGRINMTLDMPDEQVPDMYGDPMALEQVLLNLLENAWKYGRPALEIPDPVVSIRLHVQVTSNCIWRRCIRISVEDAGPGIAPGEQRRIFGRFYRGRSGHVKQAGGIGLGLALVRDIVRGHGGKVEVGRSSLGGARFVVCFRPYPLRLSSWKCLIRALPN